MSSIEQPVDEQEEEADYTHKKADEQPSKSRFARLNPANWLYERDTSDDKPTYKPTQSLVPVRKAFRFSPAVERKDGSVVGAIQVHPANLSFRDDLDPDVLAAATMLTTSVPEGTRGMLVDVPRQANYESDRNHYDNAVQQVRDRQGHTWQADTLADIYEERASVINLYEKTTTTRDYFIVLEVTPGQALSALDGQDDSGLNSIPVVGDAIAEIKAKFEDDEDLKPIQTQLLKNRLDNLAVNVRNIGLGANVLSSARFSQVIADYFNTDDMYRHRDFESLVRQSPIPGEHSNDPEHEVDHHENDESVIAIDAEDDAYEFQYKTLLAPENFRDEGAIGEAVETDGRRLSATLEITNWPDLPAYTTLQPVYEFSKAGIDVSVSTHFHHMRKDAARRKVKNNENSLLDKLDQVEGTAFEELVRQRYEAAKEMAAAQEASNAGTDGTFETGVYIRVTGPQQFTKEDGTVVEGQEYLNQRISELMAIIRERCGLGVSRMNLCHKDGMLTGAPVCDNKFEEGAALLASGLMRLYPWNNRNLTDPNGIHLGDHSELQEPLSLDPFARSSGHNLGAYAKIGSGKTTTLQEIITRLQAKYGDELAVVVADPLEEFNGLTKIHEGDHHVVGANLCINVLALHAADPDELAKIGENTPYQDMLRRFRSFLDMYYAIEGLRNIEEKAEVWMKAVKKAFKDSDINTRDPTTFEDDTVTLGDVLPLLDEMTVHPEKFLREKQKDDKKSQAELADAARKITTYDIGSFEEGGRYHFLTQPTNIDLESNPWQYLDFHRYESDKRAGGLLMTLALHEMYSQAKATDRKVLLVFDEFHYMLKHPESAEFFEQTHRHSRHWEFCIALATQSLGELTNKDGDLKQAAKTIFDLQSMQLVQYITENISVLEEAMDLSKTAVKYIKNLTAGEKEIGKAGAYLRVDKEGDFPVDIRMDDSLNPREFALYQYDPNKHGDDLKSYLANYTDERGRDVCNWRWNQAASQRQMGVVADGGSTEEGER